MDHSRKTKMALAGLLIIGLGVNAAAQTTESNTFNIGLIYPVSSNGLRAPKCSNVFSLNAVSGISRVERGASIAGFGNFILDSATGAQVAGFMNVIRNRASGVQI